MFYTYHCETCGDFDITRSILADPLKKCPECKENIYQVLSPPTVIWKGRFRWMKFNPEIDMDKVEIKEGRGDYRGAMSKIKQGLRG